MQATVEIIEHEPVESSMGGGLEGAEKTSRETALWHPDMGSADQIINHAKPMADARAQDMVQNDGYAAGAASLHRDNIVGTHYLLNSTPNYQMLGVSREWAEEFQSAYESQFNTLSESESCYFDATGNNTFTGLINLAVSSFVITGEVLGTAEWIEERNRPFKTSFQMIAPARLSNPHSLADDRNLRRGRVLNSYGKTTAYHIQMGHPNEFYDNEALKWKLVQAETPWGRKQVCHVMQQTLPGQNRGVAEMVAALKQMRMTKKFQDIVLQNAVVSASYVAAIESDLPTGNVFELLGAGGPSGLTAGMNEYVANYLKMIGDFMAGSKNMAIDGAKIPHLPPGSKLNMQSMGTPGGVGTGFEQSLQRHIAACLGLSYEEFSRDYTQTNYSSARASMNNTNKSMASKKRAIADRVANFISTLWLEEAILRNQLPLPPGKTWRWFYEPGVKDALSRCKWVGASRGQIDEMKETQAAILRIQSNLSTYEIECARLGRDFRENFTQRSREDKMIKELGLQTNMASNKPTVNTNGSNSQNNSNQDEDKENAD